MSEQKAGCNNPLGTTLRLLGPTNDPFCPKYQIPATEKGPFKLQCTSEMCFGGELVLCIPLQSLTQEDWHILTNMLVGVVNILNGQNIPSLSLEITRNTFIITSRESKEGPALRFTVPITKELVNVFQEARCLVVGKV